MTRWWLTLAGGVLVFSLTGCDQIEQAMNKQSANGKAIGAACRHSGRALEDCYRRNPRIAKADIYNGWREMNEYMMSKQIAVVPPPPDVAMAPAASAADEGEEHDEASSPASAPKAAGH